MFVLAANLGKMDSSVANPVQEEGKVEWIWNEMYQVNGNSIINNRVMIKMILIIALPKFSELFFTVNFKSKCPGQGRVTDF